MKKLLIFAALVLAIGSYGGHIGTAHADTLTPSQTAALQQQLQVAKATLVNLEMQAGMVPAGDNGTSTVAAPVIATPVSTPTPTTAMPSAATGLSASQISAFKSTLSALATTLSQLDTSIAANSATLTQTQQQAVQTTLNGMKSTLVAMANTISESGANNSNIANSAPVAVAQPSTSAGSAGSGLAQNTPSAPAAMTAPSTTVTPTVPAQSQTQTPPVTAAVTPSTNNTVPQQTAQASSLWSFTKSHWPAIVIIILVIGILAILFWPEKETTVRVVPSNNSGSNKPKSPSQPNVTVSQSTFSSTTTTTTRPVSSNNPSGTVTPISTVVGGTHSQKI